MAGGGHHHRATLKQKNKSFKSRHSTKSSIKKLAKGRPADAASISSKNGSVAGSARNAQSRKNHAKQIQLMKRDQLKQVQELYKKGMDKVVSVLELTPDGNAWDVCRALESHKGVDTIPGYEVDSALSQGKESTRIRLPKHSTSIRFLPLPYGGLYPALSAVASSDFVIFVLSPDQSIEEGSWGELALRILHAQGMPEVLAVVPSLKSEDGGKMVENGIRKSLTSFIKYFSPSTERIHALDVEAERDGLLRTLATSVPRFPSWREARPYLITEAAEFRPDPSSSEGRGNLIIKGWTRGNANFSAQRLVHIRDHGDFRLRRILDLSDQTDAKGRRKRKAGGDVEMGDTAQEIPTTEEGIPILEARDDEEADDLQSENEVSEGAFGENEQTWPTEEEVAAGEQRQLELEQAEAKPSRSSKQKAETEDKYKTRWLIEESDEEVDSDLDENEDDNMSASGMPDDFPIAGPSNGNGHANGVMGQADEEDVDFDDDDGLSDDDAALFESAQQESKEKRSRAAEDLQFPDEVDTPLHIPARQRFARYKGLASLRSSTWDAYEELPAEYSKIFQFDDWDRIKRAVEGKARLEGVSTGSQVGLELQDVPIALAEKVGAFVPGHGQLKPSSGARLLPVTVWGLLRHEHKKTVMNFSVLRNTEYTETVKSKDPALLLIGPRLLCVNPIYSEHSLGTSTSRPVSSSADGSVQVHPHKFSRFLPPPNPTPSVATIYAPITFGSPSITLLKPRGWGAQGESGYDERGVGANQYPDLIGSGNLLKKNGNGPLRVNVKRVVITGEPFKIHRKTATIRWMFFNPEDVRYFAPIPLRTKYGRTGHISEPLGTHGRYKAHFDGPIGQMDTVMMGLYKRVYPKYTTQEYKDGSEELPVKYLENKERVNDGGQATEMDM
ncbi:unnamed protein product [Sympodiomycopsis kandeliae]